MKTLRWRDTVGKGDTYHLAGTKIENEKRGGLHDHDFFELFTVESGSGAHWVGPRSQGLKAGDLALVRPRDKHGFTARPGDGLSIINLAFPRASLQFLRRRYFGNSWAFYGGNGEQPRVRPLEPFDRAWVKAQWDELAREPRSLAKLEIFLVGLFLRLDRHSSEANLDGWPDWLKKARQGILEKEHFSKGSAGFTALAGRSAEHTARVLKKCCGLTPTDLVNRARLDHAAAELSLGNREILDISLDCGYMSLSHFYHLFRSRFHCSPRQYRLRHQVPLR